MATRATEMCEDSTEPKRRRIERACDDCRGRKIKCDGQSPCESCIHYNQPCTYSRVLKPRYGGPRYIEELETKFKRLKAAFSKLNPGIDVNAIADTDDDTIPAQEDSQTSNTSVGGSSCPVEPTKASGECAFYSSKDKVLLDTMIEATGQIDIDGRGRCDYLGDFAGLAFLNRISERCYELLDRDVKNGIFSNLFTPQTGAPPNLGVGLMSLGPTKIDFLPSKRVARLLTNIALQDACCLMRFVHQPSFDESLDRIYDLPPESYTPQDEAFIPLLYSTLALGQLYSRKPAGEAASIKEMNNMKGEVFFRAGASLVDIMDCNDIPTLQTILCMIIYFQSSSLMSSCYSYISLAIASAFRMGLHRSVVLKFFDPIEQEVRKRTFWVLQTMDTYVATMLGLPKNIRDEDLDQDMPLDIDDEFITSEGIMPTPEGHVSIMAITNAHTKLLLIMAKVVSCIYPSQKDLSREFVSYQVDYRGVVKVEAELEEWFRNVIQPPSNVQVSPEVLKVHLLLRLAYAHVQMVLYRPFIQHLVRNQPGNTSEMSSYACGSACVKAAMQVIWLVESMEKQGLLIGAYWFTAYITFFAVMSLCMFVLGNVNDPTMGETLTAAVKGREILVRLAPESASAARCVTSLGNIVDRISTLLRRATPSLPSPKSQTSVPLVSPGWSHNLNVDDPTSPYFFGPPSDAKSGAGGLYDSISSGAISSIDPMHLQAGPSGTPSYFSQPQVPLNSTLTMPLAAYGEGLGGGNASFPVFAPGWLDQASALHRSHSDSRFQGGSITSGGTE